MNREIKFRGKCNLEWFYGDLCTNYENEPGCIYIIDEDCTYIKVDIKSVGQFTGLKDKNGKEIYEGDIVVWVMDDGEYIKTNNTTSEVEFLDGKFFPVNATQFEFEIIGNIYENPKLLK